MFDLSLVSLAAGYGCCDRKFYFAATIVRAIPWFRISRIDEEYGDRSNIEVKYRSGLLVSFQGSVEESRSKPPPSAFLDRAIV